MTTRKRYVWILEALVDYEQGSGPLAVFDHEPDYNTEIAPFLENQYYDNYKVTKLTVTRKATNGSQS